jgi:hypothetical protein
VGVATGQKIDQSLCSLQQSRGNVGAGGDGPAAAGALATVLALAQLEHFLDALYLIKKNSAKKIIIFWCKNSAKLEQKNGPNSR